MFGGGSFGKDKDKDKVILEKLSPLCSFPLLLPLPLPSSG